MPIVKSSRGALAKVQEIDWRLDDFGDEPILFGLLPILKNDPVLIAVAAILSLMWAPWLGGVLAAPTALGLLLVGANDVQHATRNRSTAKREPRRVYQEPIDELPQAPTPTIGTDTRLNAVEVPSTPVAPPVAPFATATPVVVPDYPPAPLLPVMPQPAVIRTAPPGAGGQWDVVGDLSANLKSTLIIGVPGAGKGMLLSHLVRRVKQDHPEIKIVGIDPKADPKETGYWTEGFDEAFRSNSGQMDDIEFTAWIQDCVEYFKSMRPENKLLVIDEWSVVCRRWSTFDKKGFDSFINYLTFIGSSGDSRREYLIGVGQVPNAGDMGMSGGIRGIFKPIGILSNHDRRAVEAFCSTRFTTLPPGGQAELLSIMDRSPVGRAIFSWQHGEWRPMPRLENLCGYDRDSRTFTQQAQQVNGGTAVITAPPRAVAATSSAPLPTFPAIEGAITRLHGEGKSIAAELLEWLLEQGQGATFTTQAVMGGAWAKRWADRGKLSDRSKATILGILRQVEKGKFITARFADNNAAATNQIWEVTLR